MCVCVCVCVWVWFTLRGACWRRCAVPYHDDDEVLVVGVKVVDKCRQARPQISVIGEDVLFEHRVDVCPLNVLSQT